jgi:shikimate dehydrogenase
MMRRVYLIGHPIGHSVSPAMQNAGLRSIGLDWNYELLDTTPRELAGAVARLRADDCVGANVTIPHKRAIVRWLDGVTPRARAIDAVNTIIKKDGKLIGDNTDSYGFAASLNDARVDPYDKRVAIFGAGGAARAAAFTVAEAGAGRITILNRSMPHARALVKFLAASFPTLAVEVNDERALVNAHLIVNATPVGMWPHQDKSPMRSAFPADATAIDLVYRPLETRFLRQAAREGAQTVGGISMLVYQGAAAFKLWTGRDAPVDLMRQAARHALNGA